MTSCGALSGCIAAKFNFWINNLLSSFHTLPVNILWCVRLYIKKKILYYIIIISHHLISDLLSLFIHFLTPSSTSAAVTLTVLNCNLEIVNDQNNMCCFCYKYCKRYTYLLKLQAYI